MSITLGTMDVGVSFVGDASGLQSATNQAAAGLEKFGSSSAKAMRQVAEDTAQANAAMQRLATGLKGAVVGGSLAVGLVKLKNSITEMSAAIIDAQVQLDRWNNGFKFGAGGMQAGAQEMAFVRQEAQRLGLELSGSATQYMKLVAASRGSAMEGAKTREVFKAIAEAATVMGMSGEQSERAFMAVTQMMSKGKVQAEELRGQLGEHLPGAFGIAARAMGVTEVEMNKLLETGQVFSSDFLPKFAAQLRKELGPSVEGAAKSMQASLNRFETAWLGFKQNVAEAGVSDFMGGQINILSDAFTGVSERMEQARRSGSGFWGQLAAGAAGVAAFANPLNAFSYSAQSVSEQLKEAQMRLDKLGEPRPGGNIYLNNEITQTRALVAELTRVKVAQDALSQRDPRDQVGFPTRTQSIAAYDKSVIDEAQAQGKAYAELMKGLLTPQEQFRGAVAKAKDELGGLYTPEIEARLRTHYIKPTKEAAEKTDELAKLLDSLSEKSSGLNTNYTESLSTLFKGFELGKFGAGEDGLQKYREAVELLIKQQPFYKDGLRDQAKAMEDARRAAAAYASDLDRVALADAKVIEMSNAYIETVDEQVKLTRFEASLMGETAVAREIAIRQFKVELELQKQILAIKKELSSEDEQAQAIARVTSAAQRLKANAAAEVVNEEFKRVTAQIEQSLTDALMRGFENGKGFAENLRDTVANMFKTLVLRPVVQAVVSPLAQSITGALGVPGASGVSSLVGTASNIYSMYGAAGHVGGFIGSLGSAASYGTAIGSQQSAMLAAQEMGMGTVAGSSASIGAALPWVGAGLAVLSLLSELDDSGTYHTGAGARYSAAGGAAPIDPMALGTAAVVHSGQTQTMAATLVQGVVGMLDATATTFGKQAGYSAATAFADDTSKDGAWGALAISRGGQTLVDWAATQTSRWAPREFADGEAGRAQYAAAVALDVRNLLLEQTPEWADTMLNALGDAPTLEQLAGTVAQIHAAAAAIDTMGRASEQFASLSESALDALVTAMGGAEAAVAGLGNYYSSFYTDAERADVTRSQLQDKFTGLGLGTLPQTREQFRDIVESLDLTTASGREMYAELIKLSPAFASITQASQDAGAAMAAAAEQAARAAGQAMEKAKTTAYSQLEASVERERTLWEQQATAAASLRDEVRGVFDTLATNIRELRGEALGPELTAAQGQAFIASALASVSAGAGLPDAEGLASAIAAVRGGLGSPGMYANSMERDFAALRLAGELSVLQEAAGEQLTTAELQLQAAENQINQLDETLGYWRKLIDGTEDGIDATMSVTAAVDKLRALMFPELQGQGSSAAAGSQSGARPGTGGFVIGGGIVGAGAPRAEDLSRLGNVYYGSLGTAITDAPSIDRLDSISSYISTLDWGASNKAASAEALGSAALQYGVSAREISIATGYNQADIEALLPRIPRYAVGTNYVPQDGPAYLHKGEAVVPEVYNPAAGAPYQPFVAPDNTQVVALLQQIATRVAALEGHAATSAEANTQTAGVLNSVSQDNALTTSPAPTIA